MDKNGNCAERLLKNAPHFMLSIRAWINLRLLQDRGGFIREISSLCSNVDADILDIMPVPDTGSYLKFMCTDTVT